VSYNNCVQPTEREPATVLDEEEWWAILRHASSALARRQVPLRDVWTACYDVYVLMVGQDRPSPPSGVVGS